MPQSKKGHLITAAPAVAVEAETTDDAAARHHQPSAIEPAARVLAENGRDETTAHRERTVKKPPILLQSATVALQTAENRGPHADTVILTALPARPKVKAGDQDGIPWPGRLHILLETLATNLGTLGGHNQVIAIDQGADLQHPIAIVHVNKALFLATLLVQNLAGARLYPGKENTSP